MKPLCEAGADGSWSLPCDIATALMVLVVIPLVLWVLWRLLTRESRRLRRASIAHQKYLAARKREG